MMNLEEIFFWNFFSRQLFDIIIFKSLNFVACIKQWNRVVYNIKVKQFLIYRFFNILIISVLIIFQKNKAEVLELSF